MGNTATTSQQTSSNSKETRNEEPVIGIDLGTSYSSVGVWRQNRVEIIPDKYGNRRIPSCVAFTRARCLIGHGAKDQHDMNTVNTITESKRLIGRRFNDSGVRSDIGYCPFEVITGKVDKLMIVVRYKDEKISFSPEEITSMLFMTLREMAESYLGCKVKNAVIAVPACFSYSQRQATWAAARIAGLEVMRIINEPSAAAIAYGYQKKVIASGKLNVLIFDLGGGKLDVSLVRIESGIFQVKGTAGDSHLGGKDFDSNMVNYFVEEFLVRHRKDIRTDASKLSKVRTACEKAKRVLSTNSSTSIEIDNLSDGIDFFSIISRSRFEEINHGLFLRCIKLVRRCLMEAKMNQSIVDEVVLVGGSTRIPKIQELLKDFFGGRQLFKGINQDEAVVNGAAIQAAMMTYKVDPQFHKLLLDVTTHSFGLQNDGGSMTVLIPKNTTIPTKRAHALSITFLEQNKFGIQVYEGEESLTMHNKFLGSFELQGIPPVPRGAIQITVIFDVDANGILEVLTESKNTNLKYKTSITNASSRLSHEEISEMIEHVYKYKKENEAYEKQVEAKNALEKYTYDIKNSLTEIEDAIYRTINWLECNELSETKEYEDKMTELETTCLTIISKNKQKHQESA